MRKLSNIINNNRGLTLPELLVYLAVLATVGIFIANRAGNVLDGTRLEQAAQEIQTVMVAGQSYRAVEGNYGGLVVATGIETLKDNGYNVREYTDGQGENTYGKDITIAAKGTPPDDAEITYETDTASACEQLRDRVENHSGTSNVVCTAAILKFELD